MGTSKFDPDSSLDQLTSGLVMEVGEGSIQDILSQRWSLFVITQLASGPKRFNILAKTTQINPNTLRERLRELEDVGIVQRKVLSAMPPRVEYSLTSRASGLADIALSLQQWIGTYAQQAAAVVDSSFYDSASGPQKNLT